MDMTSFLNLDVRSGDTFYHCTTVMKSSMVYARPLGEDSCHRASIHRLWPINTLTSMMRFRTRGSDRESLRNIVVGRFSRFGGLLSQFRLTRVLQVEHPRRHDSCKSGDEGSSRSFWCTVPFHQCYAEAISNAVAAFNCDSSAYGLLHGVCAVPLVRVSWSNAVPLVANSNASKRRMVG